MRGRLPLVILTLALAGLGWLVTAALRVKPSSSPRDLPVHAGYPRVLDVGGATLRIARRPMRVVPTSARAVDLVTDLIDPSRVAGLPEQAIEYATLGDQEPRFRDLPRFDVYLAEPVLALRPDLIVADTWQAADTHQRLREAGVTVLVLPEMSDWDDACRDLRLLGEALDASARAEEIVSTGDEVVARLRERARQRPSLGVVTYSNFGAQGFSAGADTTLDHMMELCGVTNRLAEQGRVGHGELTFEDLLHLDPDAIIVSRPLHTPAGHSGDRGGASEQLLLREESLQSLRAVRDRRIVSLPPGLFASASHRIVHGAEILADELDALLERLDGEARR